MSEQTVIVADPLGLHARPVGMFVKKARSFQSKVTLRNAAGKEAAAQAFAILSLGVKGGQAVTVRAEGPDADEAVAALVALITNDFVE